MSKQSVKLSFVVKNVEKNRDIINLVHDYLASRFQFKVIGTHMQEVNYGGKTIFELEVDIDILTEFATFYFSMLHSEKNVLELRENVVLSSIDLKLSDRSSDLDFNTYNSLMTLCNSIRMESFSERMMMYDLLIERLFSEIRQSNNTLYNHKKTLENLDGVVAQMEYTFTKNGITNVNHNFKVLKDHLDTIQSGYRKDITLAENIITN